MITNVGGYSGITPSGSEHPYCDKIQLIMLISFFGVWGADSFIFNYSTSHGEFIPLPLRLFLGLLSASIGIYLGVKSHKAVFSDAHDQPRLIDSGVYSRVRHPMYLGTLLFCLGFFLSSFSLLSLVIWAGFFAFYDKMTAYEEKDLVRLLGKQYITYQNKVPKWIPHIRTKD